MPPEVIVENATVGCNAVLGSLPLRPGDEILLLDHGYGAVRKTARHVAGHTGAVIVETGPSASLLGMGRRCVPKLETTWLPSLREGQDEWSVITGSVAEYYVRGGRIDWRGWDRPAPGRPSRGLQAHQSHY